MWNYFGAIVLTLTIHAALGENVKVSVFYESLCPDSINFIKNQLFPTYKSIGNDMIVDLIPFGNAEFSNSSGKLEFQCQHGVKECYGNMIQSCAIALYGIEESTEFIYCAMKSDDPASDVNLEECSKTSGISWASLKTCYTSGQASKLLEMNGVRTKNFQPAIKFVPTVAFNDFYSDSLESDALENLASVVCKFLDYVPEPCKANTVMYEAIQVVLV